MEDQTTTKRHRGFTVKINLIPEGQENQGYFYWICLKDDGEIIAESKMEDYNYVGEDVDDAFANAKEAINNYMDN